MKTTHRTTIVSKCPHGANDVYEATFHVEGRVVTVEAIQDEIHQATAAPVYQENLTERLATRLKCRVVTVGMHGRFETTCESEPTT